MNEFVTNYLVKQSIESNHSLLYCFLSNVNTMREHEIQFNDNFYLHLIVGEEDTVVSLIKRNPEQAITIGSFCSFQSVNDKMEWIIDSMSYYVFNCVMKDLKIEKYLEPDYKFTEQDYNKLCDLIGKETIIQIKTKNWDKWCLGLIKTLKVKFIKGDVLQNVRVKLI